MFNQGEHEKIIDLYNQNSLNTQNAPAESRVVAASYFSLSQYNHSHQILADLYSSFSQDIEYLSLYGACCRRLQKYDLADQIFQEALTLSPNNPPIINNYSNLLIDIGNYAKAITLLESLVSENPSYVDAVENLKRVKFLLSSQQPSLGTPEEKNKSNSHASASDLQNKLLTNPLDLAFTTEESDISTKQYLEKYSKSEDQLTKSIPKVDDSSLISDQLDLIQKFISSSNFSEALLSLDRAYSSCSQTGRFYKLASDCYVGLGRLYEAEICLTHSISLDGPSPDSYINLASFSLVASNYSLSRFYLSKAVSLGASTEIVDKIKSTIDQKENSGKSFSLSKGWSEPIKLTKQL